MKVDPSWELVLKMNSTVLTETTFTKTIAEVQADQSQLGETIPKQPNTMTETVLLLFFGVASLGAIATFLTKEFHKKKAEEDLKNKSTRIPCPNCQFFSKSSYLRCAVQPKLTMTNEATECPDFTPCSKK